MSALYKQLTVHVGAFAVVYGIFLSFGELGPGNCLGLLAAKSGPTAVRGQFYGMAAAIGKVGAFVGTWCMYLLYVHCPQLIFRSTAFPPIIEAFGGSDTDRGNTGPFWVGSGLAILSAIVVFVFVRPLSHDGMLEEDENFRAYLAENGYDVSLMGLASESGSVDAIDEKVESSEDIKLHVP